MEFIGVSRFGLGKSPAAIDRVVRGLVRDAGRFVPYYRSAFAAAGVSPDCVRGREDLARLPITTKESLLTALEGGWLREGADPRRCFRSSTSGTTGLILTTFLNRSEMYFRRVSLVLALGRNVPLRFPLSIVDIGAPPVRRRTDLAQRLGVVKVSYVSLRTSIAEQVDLLRAVRPAILEGRPSLLNLLAEEVVRRDVRDVACGLVAATGEVLHQPVRDLLQQAFRANVRDYYNCEEIGNLAWECPTEPGVMHVNTDVSVLEIVDEAGRPVDPGDEGRLVVTSLYNRTMPFIRYELGDRAVLRPRDAGGCRCGHQGPSLSLIGGRDEDYLILPDGSRISPRLPFRIVWDQLPVLGNENRVHEIVRSFQLVQESPDRLILRVVPGTHYDPRIWRDLEAAFRTVHRDLSVSVRLEEAIDLGDGTGKFSGVVSRAARSERRRSTG